MIMDDRSELADWTPLPAGQAGTFNIGDVIDRAGPTQWPNPTANLHSGLYLVALTAEDVNLSGGSLVLRLVSGPTAVISTLSPKIHFTSGAFAASQLTKGRQLFAWPMDALDADRYLGVQAIVTGGLITSGKLRVFMTNDFSSLGRVYAKAAQ